MVLAVLYGIGKEIQDFDFINVRCCLKTSSNLQNREDYFIHKNATDFHLLWTDLTGKEY